LVEKYKKKGIDKDFIEALKEVFQLRVEYAKRTAEIIARNKIIARKNRRRTYKKSPRKHKLKIIKCEKKMKKKSPR